VSARLGDLTVHRLGLAIRSRKSSAPDLACVNEPPFSIRMCWQKAIDTPQYTLRDGLRSRSIVNSYGTWQAVALPAHSKALLSLATGLFFYLEHLDSLYVMFLKDSPLGILDSWFETRWNATAEVKSHKSSQPLLDMYPVTPNYRCTVIDENTLLAS
jgi:hypothetical protein